MTTTEFFYFEEWHDYAYVTADSEYPGWIACGYGYKWTLDQCRQAVMERKAVSPRSKLRIVRETRAVWTWRERTNVHSTLPLITK